MSKLIYSSVNIESVCRFCLDPTDLIHISSPLDIYCRQNRTIDLGHVIMTCIGVKVCGNDKLPKWICKECVNQLTTSYKFREKCLETMQHLNDLLLIKQTPATVSESSTDFIPETFSSTDSDQEFQVSTASPNEPNSTVIKPKNFDEKRRPDHFHCISHGRTVITNDEFRFTLKY